MQICKLGLNCPTSQMGRLRAEDCIAQGEMARGFGRIKGAFLEEVVAVTSFEDKHPPSRMFQPLASLGLMTGPRGPLRALPRPSRSPSEGRPHQARFSDHRASSEHQATKRLFSLWVSHQTEREQTPSPCAEEDETTHLKKFPTATTCFK